MTAGPARIVGLIDPTTPCADPLDGTGVRIATAAFPAEEPEVALAVRTTPAAVLEGADEVGVVAPWRAFPAGDEDGLAEVVAGCAAAACAHLEVSLEAGSHPDEDAFRRMAEAAAAAGPSFWATPSGTVQGASPEELLA